MKRGKEVGHMKEIFNRRSIRKYTGREVEPEKIDRLLRAAMQAPSAANQQPWEFIVVKDKEMLQVLSEVNPFASHVANSFVAFVLVANGNALKAPIAPFAWQQDMGAAAENLWLEAVHLNLGASWLGVATTKDAMDNIQDLFALPDYVKPFAVISVGYPDEEEHKFVDRYDATKVHYEKW
jgi:nitroreductase